VLKNDIKTSEELSIPQRSCFHRCTIKLQEALRFTQDMLKFQTYEINRLNAPAQQQQAEPSLMEKLHSIYEEQYGRSAQPNPFKK
jgi:hypothetical protein